jgi:hypothetical protein
LKKDFFEITSSLSLNVRCLRFSVLIVRRRDLQSLPFFTCLSLSLSQIEINFQKKKKLFIPCSSICEGLSHVPHTLHGIQSGQDGGLVFHIIACAIGGKMGEANRPRDRHGASGSRKKGFFKSEKDRFLIAYLKER